MPVLKDFRKIVEVSLPSFPGSKIEVYQGVLVKDAGGLSLGETVKLEDALKLIPKVIKSWNFTDDAGKPLPITVENLGLLGVDDITTLVGAFMPSKEEKKN
jgi:hypothetical protein